MNNKYIDNKLKEYDKRFNGILGLFTSNLTVRVGKGEKVEVASVDKSEEIRQFIKEALESQEEMKIKCGCSHKAADYWCICWFEGYEMGQAEIELKSEQEACNGTCRYAGNICVTHCQKPEEQP